MGGVTSIRQNSQPAAGSTAQQPAAPNLTPADIQALVEQLTPTITRFRKASTPQDVILNQQTMQLGTAVSTRITSVGLGFRTRSEYNIVITATNANSGAAATFKVSPWFPYNLVTNTQVNINGGTVVYSASGPAGLLAFARNRRGFWVPSYGVASPGSLNEALVTVTYGSNATATDATSFSISGTASVSIAESTSATITIRFVTFEKLAYSRDSLLGALPLQNNSVYAALVRQLVGTLGVSSTTKQTSPFYDVSADISFALTSATVDTTYSFWSVPSDPGLYADMVRNSYQIQEQPGQTASATGDQAIQYDIPQNAYVLAAHMLASDSTGTYLTQADVPKLQIQYNGGSVIPVVQQRNRTRAEQFADYGADLGLIPGYFLWDGDDTAESLTATDDAGWLDSYSAATPQLVASLDSGVSTPVTYSLTREAVVSGSVRTVGG